MSTDSLLRVVALSNESMLCSQLAMCLVAADSGFQKTLELAANTEANNIEIEAGAGANVPAALQAVPKVSLEQEEEDAKTKKQSGKKVLKKILKGAKRAGKVAKKVAIMCVANDGTNELLSQQVAIFVLFPVI